MRGLSVAFDTGSSNVLEGGAVVKEETAMHVTIDPSFNVSVSTQIGTLRRFVFEELGHKTWNRVRKVKPYMDLQR